MFLGQCGLYILTRPEQNHVRAWQHPACGSSRGPRRAPARRCKISVKSSKIFIFLHFPSFFFIFLRFPSFFFVFLRFSSFSFVFLRFSSFSFVFLRFSSFCVLFSSFLLRFSFVFPSFFLRFSSFLLRKSFFLPQKCSKHLQKDSIFCFLPKHRRWLFVCFCAFSFSLIVQGSKAF